MFVVYMVYYNAMFPYDHVFPIPLVHQIHFDANDYLHLMLDNRNYHYISLLQLVMLLVPPQDRLTMMKMMSMMLLQALVVLTEVDQLIWRAQL
jgi:hypothetical protein